MAQQQRAQNHDAAFGAQKFRRRDAKLAEDKPGETLERKNLQARVAGERATGEQLSFQLKCRLFGRKKNERITGGIFGQCGTHFGEAAEGLAAAGGAEEKVRLHGEILTQRRKDAKAQGDLIVNKPPEFFISFPEIQFTISAVGKIKLENLCH
jgi:hypothetical protein